MAGSQARLFMKTGGGPDLAHGLQFALVEMPTHLYPFSVLPYLHGQDAYCVLCDQTDAFG